ncbi:unnamed protein product [Rotaria sordida]|uniref:MULE transposase domain-containing protein n=1 Tax=Rotaria sordida TaxID=392033 RepID=A0A815HUR1_9BILA|nr:unnamed protein product [Rotaria sordida]
MEVFIKEPSEYSHVPDPNRLHIVRLKNILKERGASSDEGDTTILFDVLHKVPLSVSANLSTNEALLQTIRREQPAIPLDHNGRLPLILLRQTERGENFIFYEDESMVIFTCDKNLLICPKSYYQLFTVHGIYSSQIIPLVYVLLIGKDTNDYNKFFEQLMLHYDYDPESILVGFESGTLKSTKAVFPDAIQIGNRYTIFFPI